MAKHIAELKRTINWLGFELPYGKWGITVYGHAIVTCILTINSLLFVLYKWEDVGKRLDGIKGLVLLTLGVMYFMALSCDWEHSILLVNLMEEGLYKDLFHFNTKEIKLRKQIENGISRMTTIWHSVTVAYAAMVVMTPILIFLYRLFQYHIDDIKIEMLFTALPFYFPKHYETIPVYVFAYILQSFCLFYGTFSGYVALVTAFNSMQLIEGDLQLLVLSFQEFDSMSNKSRFITSDFKNCLYSKHSLPSDDNSVKFLKYFVEYHYSIYRNVHDVTKGIQLVAFSINSGMSILLCTASYSIAKRKEMIIVTQEAVFGSFITFCLYCYNLMGEKISTEDENLRKALYESKWYDKPQWFKKSLQIIMSRTNRPIEMKSIDLFVLSLRNFLLTVRAAYSYYNVLSNM